MRRGVTLLLVACGICAMASITHAQRGASELAAPRPTSSTSSMVSALATPAPSDARRPHPTDPALPAPAAEEDPPEEDSAEEDSVESVIGPRIELGYALYSLSDGETTGRVHAGSFGGYFHTGSLRLGCRAEVGKRADRLGVDDVLVRAIAVAGYQHRRSIWVPYLVAVASYGWLIEQGAGAPRTAALPGGGLELGLDLRLGAVFLGLSAGWTRVWLRGDSQDLWLLRVRAGV